MSDFKKVSGNQNKPTFYSYCLINNQLFKNMKKLTLILSMMIALVGLNANAAMYIVGNVPFGDWNPGGGVEMTDTDGDGVYTYVTDQINGTVWFVFGDGLDAEWNVFNNGLRIGPLNGNEEVKIDTEYTTQKSTNSGASYFFEGTAGEAYTISFDTNTMKFKIEGYVAPVEYTSFTVAGDNANIFGTTWDVENTDNDMTLDETDGLYKLVKKNVEITAGTLYYKVAANHAWGHSWGNPAGPDGNQDYYFEENGTYDLTFMFDLANETVWLEAEMVQVGPEINPITGHLYMVGQVNDNAWNPSAGVEMVNDGDDDTFTLANVEIKDAGDGYGYFSFIAMLGAGANSWPADGYRIGAAEDGTEAVLNEFVDMGGFGTTGAFKMVPGFYNVTVVLSGGENGLLKLTAGEAPQPVVDDVYIIGDVNNIGWSATEGVQMTYNEGVYTAQITTQKQGDLELGYFGFTKKLADPESETAWDDIAAFRFGPVSDDAFVMTEELIGVDCALATDGSYNSIAMPEGTWTVTVDLEHNLFSINGEWPTVEPEHYEGDVYILGEVNDNGGWFPNVGVKMTRDAQNNVYTATITTAGENVNEGEEIGYSYFSFTKKLAENDAENGGWDEINNGVDRFGAVTDGNPFLVTDEMLGIDLSLAYAADPMAFKIPAGKWNLTLSVDNKTLVIEKAEGLLGDVNNDGVVRVDDVTALIDYLLGGNAADLNIDNGDCNNDGATRIDDVTILIDYLLVGEW